jgi:hypothetical protein
MVLRTVRTTFTLPADLLEAMDGLCGSTPAAAMN